MMIACLPPRAGLSQRRRSILYEGTIRLFLLLCRIPWRLPPAMGGSSYLREQFVQLLLGLSEFLLKTSQQLFLLPLLQEQIIVRQVGILLFEFAGKFIPVALERVRIHVMLPSVDE